MPMMLSWALVFDAFSGFLDFLEAELGILEEGMSLMSSPTLPGRC